MGSGSIDRIRQNDVLFSSLERESDRAFHTFFTTLQKWKKITLKKNERTLKKKFDQA